MVPQSFAFQENSNFVVAQLVHGKAASFLLIPHHRRMMKRMVKLDGQCASLQQNKSSAQTIIGPTFVLPLFVC